MMRKGSFKEKDSIIRTNSSSDIAMNVENEDRRLEKKASIDNGEENLIQCDGMGDVLFIDDEERKFYAAFHTCDLVVKLGDCVRIKLESDESTDLADCYAFGQILAIYEDNSQEIYVEVRWFLLPDDISKQKRMIIQPLPNELVESDQLDDIPAGAVCEVIHIKGLNPDEVISSDHFICRYFDSSESKSVQKVLVGTMLKRGMEFSHYQRAYANYLSSHHQLLTDDFSVAIQRLQISVIPDQLPCRENERKKIDHYLREVIVSNHTKPPLYICGMPGTGKTATVLSCINALRKETESKLIPEFDFIEINCLRLKSPIDAYTQLWRGLTGYHVGAKSAQQRLNSYFTSSSNTIRIKANATTTRERILICLMDELDFLLTRDFRVIYNLFDWSMYEKSGFLLIGISNTMDLPERITARVESRTRININREIFQAYTSAQVKIILEKRLEKLNLKYFSSHSIQFIAMKAAGTVSDLRAALQICQTTLEMYRDHLQKQQTSSAVHYDPNDPKNEEKDKLLIMNLVKASVDKYKGTPFITVMNQLCELYKVILIIFCKHRRLVCGGDEHSSIAGLTAIMAWEKFLDFMDKVKTDSFYRSTTTTSGAVEVGRDKASAITSSTNTATSTAAIKLRIPPFCIFQEALNKLLEQKLFSITTSYHTCGRSITVYHLNSALLYSDLLAALVNDPWHKYLLA